MSAHTDCMWRLLVTLAATTVALAVLQYPQEIHFKNVRQLSFGGQNAEAYWSFDDTKLVYQATGTFGSECDQIYRMDLDGQCALQSKRISTGLGVCTCSYFMPDNSHTLFASTHATLTYCPGKTCDSQLAQTNQTLHDLCMQTPFNYTWDMTPEMEIYVTNDMGHIVAQLTNNTVYDAEATVSPDGTMIVFTSMRSGDPELWIMDLDGSNKRQVTDTLGYDGGAFFSPDSKQLVFRATQFNGPDDVELYKELLEWNIVSPINMELYTINVDGTDRKQITHLGAGNWAPYWHPSGKKIIFASNYLNDDFGFNLFMINADGTGEVEQISYDPEFDSFPMFSFSGEYLVFESNRNTNDSDEFNIFIAEWIDNPKNLTVHYPQEVHFGNVTQVSFGGQNAEAYWSFDDTKLVYQATGTFGSECDQIYKMDLDGQCALQSKRISTGLGVCTCSYFMPDNSHTLFASTHATLTYCPGKTCDSQLAQTNQTLHDLCMQTPYNYTWDLTPEMEIYVTNDMGHIVAQLTNNTVYDAEATVSPDGTMIVFTSMRSGDPELWIMDLDGSNKRQVTDTLGYDGGAYFSPDSKQLVFRATQFNGSDSIELYKELLEWNIVSPINMELYTINIDGTDRKQITHLGAGNWAPYWHPSGKKIIFASNYLNQYFGFNLFMINADGSGEVEQISWDPEFDSFPMFSFSGKYLAFESNRNTYDPDEFNIFIAEWIENP